MTSSVRSIPAADSATAAAHFERRLTLETDCWDVHEALSKDAADFVILDVRSPEMYTSGHVPGAVNVPHAKIIESKLANYPRDTLFIVYCGGPHCNGADRAAARLARLGRPVKLMLGGITGWKDEGFALVDGTAAPREEERPIEQWERPRLSAPR
jgi:rhodanese-related sulfurtransferase